MRIMKKIEKLEESGQFITCIACWYAYVPKTCIFPCPRDDGVTKPVRHAMKTKTEPAATPGSVNGNVILENTVNRPAPSVLAASTTSLSICNKLDVRG